MELHNRLLSVGSIGAAVVSGSFLHPLVTGQVGVFSGHRIGTGLVAPAVVFAGLAVLLGVVAFRSEIGFSLRPSTQAGRRVAAVALASFVIVTAMLSGVGGPASPVGTVEAGYFEGCEFSDSLTFAIGASLGLSNQECKFYTPDYDTSNLSQTDAYANGLALNDSQESFQTTTDNFAQDTRSVAWAKAKISIINDLNNNVSEAQALENANETVEDYYITQEKNALNSYSSTLLQIEYLQEMSSEAIAIDDSATAQDFSTWEDLQARQATYNSSVNQSVKIEGRLPYVWHTGIPGYTKWSGPWPVNSSNDTDTAGGTSGALDAYVNDTDSSKQLVFDGSWYHDRQTTISNQHDQITANLVVYVNETYAAYEAGEIDSTDLAASDPTTIATQAATDYNSTGYYGLASAQLAAMGLSGNNSVSHVVNTTENGSARVISGTVYYTGEDSQTFTTGTQYDPSTLNGSVYMSVASIEDGNGTSLNKSGGFYHVQENFTISSATNTQTGEAVNTTTMETRNYSSTNVSALAEEIDRLKEQRAFYEEQLASSGGGFGIDFGGTGTGMVIAIVAVLVLMIATRN
jgi:hypothetical protein